MNWLRWILNLCRKEFLAVLKDPANRTILFLPVILQSVLFGYAASFDLTHASYALLDHSHSNASHELVQRLESTGVFERVATLDNESQIADWIDNQKALMVLNINANFADQLSAGQKANVQVIFDARNSTTAGTAAAQLQAVVARFNTDIRVQQAISAAPLAIETRAWYNPNLESRWQIMPSLIATLSMLQITILAALSVSREREQGTFDQLLVTPYRPLDIMIGKAIPPVVIGLAQSTLTLLIVRFWFDVPFAGSIVTLYACLSLFTLSAVGIGLSISALSLNMQQATLYSFVLLMPMVLLSGLVTPVRNMPEILQWLTMADPLRYAVDMVRRIYLEGVGFWTLRYDWLPLIAISMVTLPSAAWLFRHRLA